MSQFPEVEEGEQVVRLEADGAYIYTKKNGVVHVDKVRDDMVIKGAELNELSRDVSPKIANIKSKLFELEERNKKRHGGVVELGVDNKDMSEKNQDIYPTKEEAIRQLYKKAKDGDHRATEQLRRLWNISGDVLRNADRTGGLWLVQCIVCKRLHDMTKGRVCECGHTIQTDQ